MLIAVSGRRARAYIYAHRAQRVKQVHRFSGLKWCLFLLLHTCVIFLVFGLRNISAHLSSNLHSKGGYIVLFTMDRKRMGIYFIDQTHNIGQ